MILAHASVGDHAATISAAVAAFAVYWALWMRNPTATAAPLRWAAAGATVIVAVSLPPVEAAAGRSFTAHMVQHLILWVVAPPLLLAAHPIRTARRGGLVVGRQRSHRFVADHARARMVVAWGAIVTAMYGTHLTPLYDAALGNQWLHEVEHAAYLAASVLLWSSVLGTGRRLAPSRAALAVAAMASMVFLGVILSSTDTALYPTYLARLEPDAALRDQRAGAALMWLGSMAGMIPLLIAAVWRWAAGEHEMQLVIEQAEAAGHRGRVPRGASCTAETTRVVHS